MQSKRILSLLLALVMTAGFAASCSQSDPSSTEDGTSNAISDSSNAESQDAETEISDNLPERNYDGYNFRVVTWEEVIGSEEETGEVLEDAIYRRDRAFEERYGVVIKSEKVEYTAATEAIRSSVLAGSDDYDMGMLHMVSAATAASGGYFYFLNDLDYIDPTQPWWDQDCIEAFTVGGDLMMLCGIMLPRATLKSACMVFNKQLFDNNGIEYPYATASAGSWTLDSLYDIIKDATYDFNGDGQITPQDDFFGMTSWYLDSPYNFYYGGGGTLISEGDDGFPTLNLNLEHNVSLYEKIYNCLIASDSCFITDASIYDITFDPFLQDRAYFASVSLSTLTRATFREMASDYGVLPNPKYDENQEDYMSFVNGAASMVVVPASITDPERTGILVEALASESYRNIRETLFEITAKTKSTRDEESTEMMDLVMSRRAFDFGYAHLYDQAAMNFMRDLLTQDSHNVSSTLTASESALADRIKTITEAYAEHKS